MATAYGVRYDDVSRGGPPFQEYSGYNLFEAFADAQKGIDVLLWDFTDSGGFCDGTEFELALDIYEGTQPVTAVKLTPYIVLSGPRGDRYPLDEEGVIAGARFPDELEEDELEDDDEPEGFVEVAGRRLTAAEFPSFARPWIDWSMVPFDPISDEALGSWAWEVLLNRPFGLHDLPCSEDALRRILRCDPAWLAADDHRVVRIAEHIRETGNLSGLGVLADALDEAGCDNPWFPWHLRLPAEAHARGSWVVGYLLEQATESD
jgi:hypothetical protein